MTFGLIYFSFLYFSEIEAKEACDWLRAAGFPQYAQLYEGRSAFLSFFYSFLIKFIGVTLIQLYTTII